MNHPKWVCVRHMTSWRGSVSSSPSLLRVRMLTFLPTNARNRFPRPSFRTFSPALEMLLKRTALGLVNLGRDLPGRKWRWLREASGSRAPTIPRPRREERIMSRTRTSSTQITIVRSCSYLDLCRRAATLVPQALLLGSGTDVHGGRRHATTKDNKCLISQENSSCAWATRTFGRWLSSSARQSCAAPDSLPPLCWQAAIRLPRTAA